MLRDILSTKKVLNKCLVIVYHIFVDFSNIDCYLNPLSANPTKWSNKLKQFVANFSTNCLSVFDHYAGLALKGIRKFTKFWYL